MSQYVVTYVSEVGERALSLAVNLGNDEQGRQLASRTAQRCHAVSLAAMTDEGLPVPMAEWLNGILTTRNGNSPMVIDMDEDDEGDTPDGEQGIEDSADDAEEIEIADDDHDDEAHSFEGQCMKCKVKREFIGRVKELSNGSRQARGNCPVCGTSIVRMVSRSTPLDDEWDTEAQPAEDNPPDEVAEDIQDEIAEAISEVIEGEPIAEVAAATATVAVEFSNAAVEVEKTPRKRAAKKATADNRTPNQRAAANPVKRRCPKCEQDVDTIERAGIWIFTPHADEARGLERCPGSTTVVQGL